MRQCIISLICMLLCILGSVKSNDVCWSYSVGVTGAVYPQIQCGYNQVCSGTCYSRYCVPYDPQIDKQLDQTQCPNNYWYSSTSEVIIDNDYDLDFDEYVNYYAFKN